MIFPKYFTNKAILTFFFVLLICYGLYSVRFFPFLWLAFSSLTVIAFFFYLNKFTISWTRFSDAYFRQKLFLTALIIRVVAVLFLYLFFFFTTGQPYEFDAADSLQYNRLGVHVSKLLFHGEFNLLKKLWYLDTSDKGFPIYLGIIYTIFFKSILVARLFNALLGAWSCVLIYDLAKRNFSEPVARISGIMVMLVPNLIYYCGLHLKETVMVFLVIAFINIADKLLRAKNITVADTAILIITGGLLFFFRTILAVCLIMSLVTSLFFISERISGLGKRLFLAGWIILAASVLFNLTIKEEVQLYLKASQSNQEFHMKHFSSREGGNKFAKYGKRSIFIPIILFAPFPTLVDTHQDNIMMLSGTYYTRNAYAFFVLIALIMMFKKRILRLHVLLISFLLSYLAVLSSSGFALSGRFHLPIIPILLIFSAYGVTQMNNSNKNYYLPYLIVISILIISWNWFKLAGRGLI